MSLKTIPLRVSSTEGEEECWLPNELYEGGELSTSTFPEGTTSLDSTSTANSTIEEGGAAVVDIIPDVVDAYCLTLMLIDNPPRATIAEISEPDVESRVAESIMPCEPTIRITKKVLHLLEEL
jgi:hypothetical protein